MTKEEDYRVRLKLWQTSTLEEIDRRKKPKYNLWYYDELYSLERTIDELKETILTDKLNFDECEWEELGEDAYINDTFDDSQNGN